ncbi:hypothetical protein DWV22_08325 [Weissella confusa]|uniref:KxYKxGKxW signal peptide domain-containing protein n=1 Tax=Weissella confusa TaxID=1583 RepID=UPI000E4922A1|nr:KxYKxGKxW signal peptide domain-containing protein [Weissella confusa]MBA5933146.1 KxYKxGKxW signal peptide domain-containing protein [Weissella confusa]MBF7056059.1 KxYKxGKxW signal peptide domain-containing protein [Weissella confusa]MBJ7636058.1 KxYKxGKxW signal peptide domain-containing protein [Weissella confusa]MBJ7652612.1 KxYKxGKxW signal peptide domain-containing protein [Weissella confusa]MBJ7677100.1 KxYKxGKxW signal peptide domain-containing protein [Weissella confusa]
MSREDYQQKLADEARVQPQTHKKMYKSKKRWVIAGMTALAVGGATAMAPEDVTTLSRKFTKQQERLLAVVLRMLLRPQPLRLTQRLRSRWRILGWRQ